MVADAVRLALSNDNALEAEMSLIILQWKHLDEMAEDMSLTSKGCLPMH